LREVLLELFGAGGGTEEAGDPGITAQPDSRRPSANAVRLLLAEDNRTNRDIVLALLRREGLEADAVANGAEALEAISHGDYGLVLMDVQMPVLDGLEAARRIRALPGASGRVPIVAMTAHAMRGDRERCLAAGMNDYLSKPLDPALFQAVLRRHLRRGGPGPSAPACVPVKAPRIDQARLADLERTLPPDSLGPILANWKDEAAAAIAEMDSLAEAGDLGRLSRFAHGLKGSAGMVGAARLSILATALEETCSRRDPEAVRSLVGEVASELPETIRELDRHEALRG
jgi:CheY-like chemotaxis protein/HPt (histidine-containing phosphotransfer) domain-containing protein